MLMTSSDFLDLAAQAQAKRIVDIRQRCASALSTQSAQGLTQALCLLAHARASGSTCANAALLPQPDTIENLISDGIARVASTPFNSHKPSVLVIDQDSHCTRIYDERSFDAERTLATEIVTLARGDKTKEPPQKSLIIPASEQDQAVTLACNRQLAIITGGPGTGKTTTVVKILCRLLAQNLELNIALTAPTGKAAGRMKQAVYARAQSETNPKIRQRLMQLQSCTLHRLLSTSAAGAYRPDKDHPLACDVLVVDESSMIDNDLAVALFAAIDPTRTRVILLGDRFQLAAVGPGSVYADLCKPQGALATHIAELTVSHRFESTKAIGKLSTLINEGRDQDTMALLEKLSEQPSSDDNRICWEKSRITKQAPLTAAARQWVHAMAQSLIAAVLRLEPRIMNADTRASALAELARIYARHGALCATREGPMSVAAVNDAVNNAFMSAGLPSYLWRQVVVRHNDPSLEVYNGDVGIIVPSLHDSTAEVYFGDTARILKYALLPPHDTAFAITIHQSQGSEYAKVGIFLSPIAQSSINTRELLYTAVTRVKDEYDLGGTLRGTLTIFATPAAISHAVLTRTERLSGLATRLQEAYR